MNNVILRLCPQWKQETKDCGLLLEIKINWHLLEMLSVPPSKHDLHVIKRKGLDSALQVRLIGVLQVHFFYRSQLIWILGQPRCIAFDVFLRGRLAYQKILVVSLNKLYKSRILVSHVVEETSLLLAVKYLGSRVPSKK